MENYMLAARIVILIVVVFLLTYHVSGFQVYPYEMQHPEMYEHPYMGSLHSFQYNLSRYRRGDHGRLPACHVVKKVGEDGLAKKIRV